MDESHSRILLMAVAAVTIVALVGNWISNSSTDSTHFHSDKNQAIAQLSHLERARRILQDTPLIDGHNDFPILIRQQLHNQIYDYQLDDLVLGSQTDFKKMETGMLGGQFWSVFMPCPDGSSSSLSEKEQLAQLNKPNVRGFLGLFYVRLTHFSG